jgi:hypothetical protein
MKMNHFRKILAAGSVVLFGMSAAFGGDSHYQPVPQLQGVWLTKITIRDCVTGASLAGPFPGIVSFQSGGTLSESGPALPNSTRGPSYGTWWRTGRNTFAYTLTFQRFDLTGIYLGSMSFVGDGGRFEVKDAAGTTLGAPGCSSGTAVRFK